MVKTTENKFNIPNLVRKYYLYKIGKGNFYYDDAKNLLSELKKMVYNKIEFVTNELLKSDDLANEIFLLLDNATIRSAAFFDSILEETNENDNRIIGYIYALVKTGLRLLNDPINDRENNILGTAIKSACNNLIQQNKIIEIKNSKDILYTLNNTSQKEIFNGQDIQIEPERIMKKDSIDRTKLEEYLLNIFNSYPNYKFSKYDLVSIVALNTEVGTLKIFKELADDESEENYIDNLAEYTQNDVENNSISNYLPQIWWERILNKYGSQDLAEKHAIIFYLAYFKGYTISKISDFFDNRIKPSTIDNYKKIFLKVLEINKDFDSNNLEILKAPLKSFFKILDKQYNISMKLGVENE